MHQRCLRMPRPPRRVTTTLARFFFGLATVRLGTVVLGTVALGTVVLGTAAFAAEHPQPPPFYAIEDARVVVGSGEVFERATVLVADGLIEAVGTDLDIPADARVIDGKELTLYPGLIDALSTVGQKQADDDAGSGRGGGFGGGGAPPIRGPEDRPGTTPWKHAADLLSTEDSRIESWREIGFTNAVSVPTDGFFAGQASVVALAGDEADDMVVAPSVAHRVAFRGNGGFRTFPGSLMGGISYVKQVLLDADHYGRANALYARSPGGHGRPTYDRTLDPIQRAVEGGEPFLLPASSGAEIDRALGLAGNHGLEAMIYGGHGAWERIDALSDTGTPVLVDLDWPTAPKDRDPDAEDSLRELAHRRLAPAVPGMLAEAGIPFAFSTESLTSADDAMEAVREAVEAGLPPAAAIEALTLGAARIFGVDDRLGSIEAGKIANLVLASDAPWAEDAEVAAVFVDGRYFAERESDEPQEPPASDPSGTWDLTMTTPRGTRDMTAEFEMSDDGKVKGSVSSEQGTTDIEEGRMSGDRLSFEMTRTAGSRTFTAKFSLIVEGEEAEGSMSAGPMSMDIKGTRTAIASADEADESESESVPIAEIRAAIDAQRGPYETRGSFAITGARVWTVSGSTLDDATVVVEGGKIAAVGTDVAIPEGAAVIDAEGRHLIPGIIDAHSHIAISGGGNEGSVAVSSMVTIDDVINPDDISIYRALAGGVTTVNVLHGSSNPIGGGNAVIKLRWGRDADGLRLEGAPKGIKFALGENPKRSNFRPPPGIAPRYPGSRMGVMDVIRQAFTEARAYRDAWKDHEAATARGDSPMPPRRDLELETLVEILEGERLVHSHCYRADEILQLLRLAEEQGFQVATLQHVLEGYKVADEIAAHGAGASTFSDWWGYKVEAQDAIPHNAALMTERGVVVSINSDSSEEMRHLNHEAAKAVRWGGMDEVAALALVTLNPAIQLGIDDRVGSIEVGKDADLALYDSHPLSVRSTVLKTWVDGDLYFDVDADRERQAAVDAMKARLAPPEDEDDEGESDETTDDASSRRQSRERVLRIDEVSYSCREDH